MGLITLIGGDNYGNKPPFHLIPFQGITSISNNGTVTQITGEPGWDGHTTWPMGYQLTIPAGFSGYGGATITVNIPANKQEGVSWAHVKFGTYGSYPSTVSMNEQMTIWGVTLDGGATPIRYPQNIVDIQPSTILTNYVHDWTLPQASWVANGNDALMGPLVVNQVTMDIYYGVSSPLTASVTFHVALEAISLYGCVARILGPGGNWNPYLLKVFDSETRTWKKRTPRIWNSYMKVWT